MNFIACTNLESVSQADSRATSSRGVRIVASKDLSNHFPAQKVALARAPHYPLRKFREKFTWILPGGPSVWRTDYLISEGSLIRLGRRDVLRFLASWQCYLGKLSSSRLCVSKTLEPIGQAQLADWWYAPIGQPMLSCLRMTSKACSCPR